VVRGEGEGPFDRAGGCGRDKLGELGRLLRDCVGLGLGILDLV
jgi:hypothetical protein